MSKMTAFLVGVLGGALAGWYATKKYYSTKCDMEISSMRELCDRMAADSIQKVDEAAEKARKAKEDRDIFAEAIKRLGYDSDPEPAGFTQKEPYYKSVTLYDNASVSPSVFKHTTYGTTEETAHPLEDDDYLSDPEELEQPTSTELQRLEEMRKRPPEQISEEIFSEDVYSGFEKKEVLWYPKDEVLLDGDNYELMDDPYSFLGTDWIETIERDGEAYVRNYRWEVDYLIIKHEGYGSSDMSLTE